jgi:glycosyltransferase involved in cell wall biosynthesis
MSKHILYVSYDGMTDPLGQSQVLPYLIGLARRGYRFTILSCEKPDRFEKYKATIEGICRTHGIEWIPLKYTRKPPVLSTIFDLIQLRRKANEIYSKDPYQMVHARSYIASLVALALKRKFKVKYIFDMRGFWADERLDGNIWKLSNPLYKLIYLFFKKKEAGFLENADHVITLTHLAKTEIHSWTNIRNNPVPISVIPCCADMDTFSLKNVNAALQTKLRKDLGTSDEDYIFLYLGSLGTWYMLEEMLDFFKVLLRKKNNAKLLFVTNTQQEEIWNAIKEKNIDAKAVMIVNAPFTMVPAYISLADSSIFFIKPVFSKKASSPVKQGELMSMGVPVVCNANVGDTGEIVEKYNSGVVVGGFDEANYEQAVMKLLKTDFNKEAIITGAKEYFSTEAGVEKYLEIYQRLLG